VTVFTKVLTVNPPVAPANRPVPPVMVAVITLERTPGVGVRLDCPTTSAKSLSPLAAVNW
jgi:hypothetical protein